MLALPTGITFCTEDEILQQCEENSGTSLCWHGLAYCSDLVPFLVRTLVHQAPPGQQVPCMMGLFLWMKDHRANVTLNIVPPSSGRAFPEHATLLWSTQGSMNPSRIHTRDFPEDAVEELWRHTQQDGWFRLIQPERVRYRLPSDGIPEDMALRVLLATRAFLNHLEGPVLTLEVARPGEDGKKERGWLDFSAWLAEQTPQVLECFLEEDSLAQGDHLGALLGPDASQFSMPRYANRPQFRAPSANRISHRQALALSRATPVSRPSSSRRL